MIKLLHLADIHIGMENYGRIDPNTGLNTRLQDFLDVLDEAIDRAIAEPVDLVVVAGDVYKTRDPTPTQQRELARRILRLSQAGIEVFFVAGNHDLPLASGRATSVDVFRALDVPHVTVARQIGTYRIETRSGPVQVIALPWLVRSHVLARDEHKNLTIEELNAAIAEVAEKRLQAAASEIDPALPAVLVGHAHVFGARLGAERFLTMGQDPAFNLAMLDLPGLSYVALGHIHRHQAMSYSDPPVVYAGSLNRVDFSEEDEEKGFVLAEVHPGRAEWQFVPVRARPFLTIKASADGDDPTGAVLRAIRKAGPRVRGAVVKLEIRIDQERQPELKLDELRNELREAFFVAPIGLEVERRWRLRVENPGALQGVTPLEALEVYLRSKDTPPDRRDLLLRYARELAADGELPAPGPGSGS